MKNPSRTTALCLVLATLLCSCASTGRTVDFTNPTEGGAETGPALFEPGRSGFTLDFTN